VPFGLMENVGLLMHRSRFLTGQHEPKLLTLSFTSGHNASLCLS
jgi:hypothetical protein